MSGASAELQDLPAGRPMRDLERGVGREGLFPAGVSAVAALEQLDLCGENVQIQRAAPGFQVDDAGLVGGVQMAVGTEVLEVKPSSDGDLPSQVRALGCGLLGQGLDHPQVIGAAQGTEPQGLQDVLGVLGSAGPQGVLEDLGGQPGLFLVPRCTDRPCVGRGRRLKKGGEQQGREHGHHHPRSDACGWTSERVFSILRPWQRSPPVCLAEDPFGWMVTSQGFVGMSWGEGPGSTTCQAGSRDMSGSLR